MHHDNSLLNTHRLLVCHSLLAIILARTSYTRWLVLHSQREGDSLAILHTQWTSYGAWLVLLHVRAEGGYHMCEQPFP